MDTASILQGHVDAAVERFNAEGFTQGQEAALVDNPNLEAAFRGERIGTFAKEAAAADPALQGTTITVRFQPGADFIDQATGDRWDITTLRQWAAHVARYGEGETMLGY